MSRHELLERRAARRLLSGIERGRSGLEREAQLRADGIGETTGESGLLFRLGCDHPAIGRANGTRLQHLPGFPEQLRIAVQPPAAWSLYPPASRL